MIGRMKVPSHLSGTKFCIKKLMSLSLIRNSTEIDRFQRQKLFQMTFVLRNSMSILPVQHERKTSSPTIQFTEICVMDVFITSALENNVTRSIRKQRISTKILLFVTIAWIAQRLILNQIICHLKSTSHFV